MDEEAVQQQNLSFPVLPQADLERVAQTILHLFSPSTSSNPELAKHLQRELQQIQSAQEAWGLIAGLAGHDDPNIRFFGAHTAQVKISRDWETLPEELRPALLPLLLGTLGNAINPNNQHSYQPANGVVVRKLFGSLASLLLRLAFPHFLHPILTVIQTIHSAFASSTALPPSAPGSGYNTPGAVRLLALEWCAICIEEIGRAGLAEHQRQPLRRHIESDLSIVVSTITDAMTGDPKLSPNERLKEAEAACKCAESWIDWGLSPEELNILLPALYDLLPMPAASSALVEVLSESIFKYGKGTKLLTEPMLAWAVGPSGQALLASVNDDPSEELIGFTKLLAALVEHSSEWLVARIQQNDVQAFLGIILRLTGWRGLGNVEENLSELTLPIYPMIQEAIMDAPMFSAPHETSPDWAVAKNFFRELVEVTRRKVRWPGEGDSGGSIGGLDKEDRENFESWRRDAGEVIVGAYYILRDEMLANLTSIAGQQVQGGAPWQDIEATLHCIRYSSEAVPLGEEKSLPILFGEQILGQLAHRPIRGKGEERLRLTVVCLIQSYEEWFKFHPVHLPPVLSYLVPSLTSSTTISRSAADALKALCDMCRKKLVEHIGAFAELHGKIGDLGPEEQSKVIQGITSVIQALAPADAVGPVEGIISPILSRIAQSLQQYSVDRANAQPALVQATAALTACFKGLSPSEDEMFDTTDEGDEAAREEAITLTREDPRIVELRRGIENAVEGLVSVVGRGEGDAEVADAISSLLKHATLSSSTLISLSPLPLLSLVCMACENSPSALWMSLASTLTLRVNAPVTSFARKKEKTEEVKRQEEDEQVGKWNVIGDVASRLVVVAGRFLDGEGMKEHPDVVEGWFKFCSSLASRFPGVLLRLPPQIVEGYMSLGLMGLGTQERFSLKSVSEYFVALLANTRYPSPLEPLSDPLFAHFGPSILRALLLCAGSEGPRSVIPNMAELLAALVGRIKGEEMSSWLDQVLSQEGYPDPRATAASKKKLKEAVLRSRTARRMREALHEFALVARGLDGTTYGNATAV
uniref:Importin-13 n=1 Tax=Kwoniella bestiolae CBS 10118 TaxID=1296100 RepID=A0A1B9G869_9TREE|nr:hypothetical protein I302_02051 [Kwoniella bestiolae CBS 10118]OCF27212.1 hypothetical protein I302_02051 [Kwoniella bestiolae CBS 10118]